MNAMAYMANIAVGLKPRQKTIPPVTNRVREVAEFVRQNPGATRAQVAQRFGCTARTAQVHMQAARINGLCRVDNKGRFSRWYPINAEQTEEHS